MLAMPITSPTSTLATVFFWSVIPHSDDIHTVSLFLLQVPHTNLEGTWRMPESNQSTFTETTLQVSFDKEPYHTPRVHSGKQGTWNSSGRDTKTTQAMPYPNEMLQVGALAIEHLPSHRSLPSAKHQEALPASGTGIQGNTVTALPTTCYYTFAQSTQHRVHKLQWLLENAYGSALFLALVQLKKANTAKTLWNILVELLL